MTQPDLRYPIGKYQRPRNTLSPGQRAGMIADIEQTPENVRAAVKGLNEQQLETPYRPGGWTVRQTVHHMADSHMNAFVRFKLGLTENEPAVKPYDEAKWAETVDGRTADIAESLAILDSLHRRWVMLLKAMKPDDFLRKLKHPEWDTPPDLDAMLAMYAWHGKHHTAHITGLRAREGF